MEVTIIIIISILGVDDTVIIVILLTIQEAIAIIIRIVWIVRLSGVTIIYVSPTLI